MSQTSTETPTYRGWQLFYEPLVKGYEGVSPDYDASWHGAEVGWVDNGLRVYADTLEAVKQEIDRVLEEQADG